MFQDDKVTPSNMLEGFEEIRARQQMHERDDFDNLTSKEAIRGGMTVEERQLVQAMVS